MTLVEFQTLVGKLPFGKGLPTAVYVFREAGSDYGRELNQLVAMLVARHELGEQFNVIKFRTDELKISFLSYPQFMEEAHPAPRHAVTIDLVTGKARHTDYGDNHNPPILHRKEKFLPENHPARAAFEALTRAEEAVGLYDYTATIGFKLNWEQLLAKRGGLFPRITPGTTRHVLQMLVYSLLRAPVLWFLVWTGSSWAACYPSLEIPSMNPCAPVWTLAALASSVTMCMTKAKLGSTRTSTSPKTSSRSPVMRTRH